MGLGQTSNDTDTPEAKEILAIERTDYFKIGLAITTAILLLAAIYAAVEWDALYAMKPNEFGDFLAGIFGPLVLLWVVMGFLQQGAELKYSREALLLQAKELKASVEAQQNMGEAAWASVHLERDIRVSADEERIRSLQPVFTLHPYTHSTNGQSFQTTLSLANSGKDGIDLTIEISDADLIVAPSRFAKFTSVERVQINVQAQQEENLKDCTLLIRYKDVEGRAFVRAFKLVLSSGILEVVDALGENVTTP